MGQSNRGTFEERKQQAIEKDYEKETVFVLAGSRKQYDYYVAKMKTQDSKYRFIFANNTQKLKGLTDATLVIYGTRSINYATILTVAEDQGFKILNANELGKSGR